MQNNILTPQQMTDNLNLQQEEVQNMYNIFRQNDTYNKQNDILVMGIKKVEHLDREQLRILVKSYFETLQLYKAHSATQQYNFETYKANQKTYFNIPQNTPVVEMQQCQRVTYDTLQKYHQILKINEVILNHMKHSIDTSYNNALEELRKLENYKAAQHMQKRNINAQIPTFVNLQTQNEDIADWANIKLSFSLLEDCQEQDESKSLSDISSNKENSNMQISNLQGQSNQDIIQKSELIQKEGKSQKTEEINQKQENKTNNRSRSPVKQKKYLTKKNYSKTEQIQGNVYR